MRRAATAAAAVLLLGSIGDGAVVVFLLAMAAADAASVLVAVLVGAATVLRFGSSSLGALAGAQAVLGPGGVVGPARAAASTWLAAAALLVAAPGGLQAVPYGLAAGALVAGPAPRTPSDLLVRAGAALAGGGLGWAAGRWLPPSWMWGGVAVGAGAVALVADRRRALVGPSLAGLGEGATVALAAGLLTLMISRIAGRRPAPSR